MEENIKEQENKVVETPTSEKKEYNVLGVMFEITKKRYYFEVIDNTEYKKGDKVIVDTVRGKEVGVVYGEPRMLPEKELVLPLKPVIKKADEDEIKRYNELKEESEKANKLCKERIIHHKLPMKLVGTEYTFDRSKLIFYFTAEGRIDFRDLVKDLANIFKLRIELRQIGVRDEAIKMARDQGLVINPAKISGVCGRLLCCINYEYAQYEEVLRHYPAVNQLVKTPKGEGKVISISPLNGYLFVDVATIGMMRFEIEEIKFNKKEANKLKNEKTQEELEHKELEKE